MHDWFTPLAPLVKVTLLGAWVVRPVGADQIGHGAEGFVARHSGPVASSGAVGKRGAREMPKRPRMGSKEDYNSPPRLKFRA